MITSMQVSGLQMYGKKGPVSLVLVSLDQQHNVSTVYKLCISTVTIPGAFQMTPYSRQGSGQKYCTIKGLE